MSASDMGPPITMQQMELTLGEILCLTENREGEICETLVRLRDKDIYALRRIHNLLVMLAPHQSRVRDMITPRPREASSKSYNSARAT